MEEQSGKIIHDFTSGSIPKQLVLFSLPLFLSNLLQVVYNMVDMIIVGQVVGKIGTSGVTIGGDITSLLTFLAIGFSNAGQIIIAQHIGAGKEEKIGKIIGNLFSFLFAGAVVLGTVSILFRTQILTVMNTPEESWEQAFSYITVCSLGIVFIYGYNIASAVLRGLGDSRHPFYFIAIAAALNIALDLLFVVVLGLESFGAALATVIAQGISFLLSLAFLWRNRDELGAGVKLSDFKFDKEILPIIVKLGIPMAIRNAAIMISKLFVNAWLNSYGVVVSSASGIESKYNSVMNLFSNAINTAAGTMIGQNIGAGKYKRVTGVVIWAAVMSFSIMTVVLIVVFAFPEAIFGLFSSDEEVVAACMAMLPVLIAISYSCAARAPMNALVNGSGNAVLNFAVAILDALIMRIGLSLLFGLVLGYGWTGFLLGDALSGFTPGVIGIVYYFSGKWKTRKYIVRE